MNPTRWQTVHPLHLCYEYMRVHLREIVKSGYTIPTYVDNRVARLGVANDWEYAEIHCYCKVCVGQTVLVDPYLRPYVNMHIFCASPNRIWWMSMLWQVVVLHLLRLPIPIIWLLAYIYIYMPMLCHTSTLAIIIKFSLIVDIATTYPMVMISI